MSNYFDPYSPLDFESISEDGLRIHTSDRATFKHCRRRWNWSSPMRGNLRGRVQHYGVAWPLWFGSICHKALEDFYQPDQVVQIDLVAAFLEHFNEESEKVKRENADYWDSYQTEFAAHKSVGEGMMAAYQDFARVNDDFTVVAAERDFKVHIGYLVQKDNGSLEFLSTGHPELDVWTHVYPSKPVYYCGRMDAVIQDNETGRYGVMDHKTAAKMEEEYFVKLEMDTQVGSYMWAAQEYAKQEGLPWTKIDFVYYNVLRKACISEPTVLKSGRLSLNRAAESTTHALFMEAIKKEGLESWFATDDKAQGYASWLLEEGDRRFFVRETVYRNQHELDQIHSDILMETADMLNDPRLYKNESASWYCTRCPFRAPCLAVNDGSDYESMLSENYTQNMIDGSYTL